MNVVDSSGWLEYFADGPNASFFAPAIEDLAQLIVPVISLYEVFKRVHQQRDEGYALQAVSLMQQGQVIELNTPIALRAARVSIKFKLPLADSIMLAAAHIHEAVLWTQDADFKDIEGVRYTPKQ